MKTNNSGIDLSTELAQQFEVTPSEETVHAADADTPKSYEKNIIDKAFEQLGLCGIQSTDPRIMKPLIFECKLDTFKTSYPPLRRMLHSSQTSPQLLGSMIHAIKNGLKRNSALVEFLEKGAEQGWFHAGDHIKTAFHMAYLLENLTFATANSNICLGELQDHYTTTRKKYGFNSKSVCRMFFKLLLTSKNLFRTTKTLSVDPGVTSYRLLRANQGRCFTPERLNRMQKDGRLNFLEKATLTASDHLPHLNNAAIQINILVAGISDYNHGFKDNALAAFALNLGARQREDNGVKEGPVVYNSYSGPDPLAEGPDEKNYHPTKNLSKAWVDLYITWNIAFVIRELDDLGKILPKLLIPSQLDTRPDEFMMNRVLTLWNVVNSALFRKLDNIAPVTGPGNKLHIAKALGRINKKYALKYVQKELGIDPVKLEKEFKSYYKLRYWNFAKLTQEFLVLSSLP